MCSRSCTSGYASSECSVKNVCHNEWFRLDTKYGGQAHNTRLWCDEINLQPPLHVVSRCHGNPRHSRRLGTINLLDSVSTREFISRKHSLHGATIRIVYRMHTRLWICADSRCTQTTQQEARLSPAYTSCDESKHYNIAHVCSIFILVTTLTHTTAPFYRHQAPCTSSIWGAHCTKLLTQLFALDSLQCAWSSLA